MTFKNFLKSHFESTKDGKKYRPSSNIVNILQELSIPKLAKIVDVGCGHNQYKSLYPNTHGFDYVEYENADELLSIENAEFENSSFDVALCLGCFHGSKTEVYKNIEKVVRWVKPNGYLIFRGRLIVPDYEHELVDSIEWNVDTIIDLSSKLNLTYLDQYTRIGKQINRKGTRERLIWAWRKN